MPEKVNWSKEASDKFEEIVNYLKLNWSEKIADDFSRKVYKKIEQMKCFPDSGITSRKKVGLKKMLITEKNLLVYQYFKDYILIVNIYDTRVNPKKIDY